ncbi:GTP cyclohydrolase IIa [Vulcanisaeta sp. JCM 16159]|uniref:GTP cyclohydrolase IIa n=1 Tax=Vulcanisaeta sp. JCM 16159 TaxID=1295371 RepID=UPI000A6692CD
MVQVTIIRLIGYREWTESLGPDREHIIQRVQSQLHNELINVFSRLMPGPTHLGMITYLQ